MANNNLQQIKLGAPTTIVGGAAPNAELSVQIMADCEELSLKDEGGKCTKNGALKTASTLLSQRVNEDVSQHSWYTPSEEKDIKVDIQGSGTTELTGNDINAMYELLGSYTSDSNISGNVHSGGAYEDEVQALMQRFPDLHIDAAKWYVKFKDSEVVKVLVANGVGDSVGITKEELAAVTDIKTWFQNNKQITSFDELSKTGVTSLLQGFQNCSNLVSADFSKIIYFSGMATQGTAIKILYLPLAIGQNKSALYLNPNVLPLCKSIFIPSAKRAHDYIGNQSPLLRIADVGTCATQISLYACFMQGTTNANYILRGGFKDTTTAAFNGYTGCKNIFVTQSSIEQYKSHEKWSNLSSKFASIGGEEWQTLMQELASEENYTLPEGKSFSDAYIDYDIYGIKEEDRPFVSFKDAEVEAVLAKNGVGGDGLITKEAVQEWCNSRGINAAKYMDGTITYEELPSDIK